MHPRPVVADHHSRFRFSNFLLAVLLCVVGVYSPLSVAQERPGGHSGELAQGYLARIQQNSPKDVEKALLRAEELYLQDEITSEYPPLAFVLHGPEVAIFFKQNYRQYKSIVDLAARLSAFGVIHVAVCETRMGVLGQDPAGLYPFVRTVPFGPREVERLLVDEEYVYF